MTLEDVAHNLDGREYDEMNDSRFFEQLAEEGLIIIYANPDSHIEIHGGVEAMLPMAGFGLMANGDIRCDSQESDCSVMVIKTDRQEYRVSLPIDIVFESFSIFLHGSKFCMGVVLETGELIRRGGVVFDRQPDGFGKIYVRGIMFLEKGTYLEALKLSEIERLPLLIGPILRTGR